ncbi:MAG: Wadjet anti-phage system protein JetD domain-containing protein [Bacteroidota bacterium]
MVRNILKGLPFEPLIIPGNKSYRKLSFQEFERDILNLKRNSKQEKGFGYSLSFRSRHTKKFGSQDLPDKIRFDTKDDFFRFLGKKKEVENIKYNASKIAETIPALKSWVLENPEKINEYQEKWDDLLKVCQYFMENPKPKGYIRELPIEVHTKFIEQNKPIIQKLLDILIKDQLNPSEKKFEKRYGLKYDEPQIRFKILDPQIAASYFSGVADLTIPLNDFKRLELPVKRVIIVENQTSLLTFLTLPNLTGTLAVFGKGYGIASLQTVSWFHDLEILYWGDLDVQGFEILSQVRRYFPHTKSIFMDQKTFDQFFENDPGTPSKISELSNLSPEESQLYVRLKQNNWRLEQEKIPHKYIKAYFQEL